MARSCLCNYNHRTGAIILSTEVFNELAGFLLEHAKLDEVIHLVGINTDTVFHETCISIFLEESRYPHTVGVCEYVSIDWKDGNCQSAEYTIARCLRRLHQSIVTYQVSCHQVVVDC